MGYRNAFYYDNRRNLTSVLDPDNGLTYYGYDALNRMTSVLNPWGEATYYEYAPGGETSKRILGNGCVTYYSHDGLGRVSKVENLKSDLSVISSFEYARDKVGNPLSILREDGSCVYFEYDNKYQLTRETQTDDEAQVIYAWEWAYDAAGNREHQVFNGVPTYYEYNAGNELLTETTEGVTTYYGYDRCGNQTAKQGVDGTTYFHYDHENLLRQIDFPEGAHNYFTYDADSKRVSAADSDGYTRFVYQGPHALRLMLERDDSGNTTAHYTAGAGLESVVRGGVSSFYHYDAMGSTQQLTDDLATVTDTYLYGPWGESLQRTGDTRNPHTFMGARRYYGDEDLPLFLLHLRHYAPSRGRFLSRDPLGVGEKAQGLLSAPMYYAYAANNPLAYHDACGAQPALCEPSCFSIGTQWSTNRHSSCWSFLGVTGGSWGGHIGGTSTNPFFIYITPNAGAPVWKLTKCAFLVMVKAVGYSTVGGAMRYLPITDSRGNPIGVDCGRQPYMAMADFVPDRMDNLTPAYDNQDPPWNAVGAYVQGPASKRVGRDMQDSPGIGGGCGTLPWRADWEFIVDVYDIDNLRIPCTAYRSLPRPKAQMKYNLTVWKSAPDKTLATVTTSLPGSAPW